jgi:hypothetical protein
MVTHGEFFPIIRLIRAGRLDQALIRLWLLAECRAEGGQALSRWRLSFDETQHNAMVEKLLSFFSGSNVKPPTAMDQQPLALIVAIDQWLGEQADIPLELSALPFLEEGGVGYWLIRRRGSCDSPADRQSPNLEQWFRHFRVIPNRIQVDAATIDIHLEPLFSRQGRLSDNAAGLGIRVSHFNDGAKTRFHESEEGGLFHATGLDAEAARQTALVKEVEALRQEEPHIWLAPELTVPPHLREGVKSDLVDQPLSDLLFCIPGSFHEEVAGCRVNRAEIVDGDGIVVASQEKLSLFSYVREADKKPFAEAVVASGVITLLATPIGIVGVAICKDFCDGTALGLIDFAWNRLAPDWLLVPSMGDEQTLKVHRQRAVEHWKQRRMRSVVANQQAFSVIPLPGFVCIEGQDEPVAAGGSTHTATVP